MLLRSTGTLLLLFAARLPAQLYPFIPVPGSPHNIEHLLQARDGRLWISTHDDLLCFDGSRFFSLRDYGLPPTLVPTVLEDSEGGILILSGGALYRFFQGPLERISAAPVLEAVSLAPGLLAASVAKTGDPRATLYRIRRVGNTWQTDQLSGWQIGDNLTRDRNGAVLVGCPGGWCEFPESLIENWTPEHPGSPIFHPSTSYVRRVFRDQLGCLWFRSEEAGAYQCPGDPAVRALPPQVAGRNVWSSIEENRDGSMLFANAGSLAMGRPDDFRVALPANGLPAEAITSAVQGLDGALWVGSIAGLYRFPYPFRMTYWKSRQGLFWSFARSRGALYAGTSAGIARLSADGEWTVLPASSQFGSVSSLLPQNDGSMYAVLSRVGALRLAPGGALVARTAPEQGGQADALAQAADGSIWLAASGIFKVGPKKNRLSLIADNPPGAAPTDVFLASDPAGAVWGCFAGTIVRRDPAGWRTIVSRGLPTGFCRALAFTPGGDVWAGFTNGFALVHPDPRGATVHSFGPTGNGDTTTYYLAPDSRGWLWRGSRDGVHIASQAQAVRGEWLHLTASDGLTDLDVNHNSFFADSDGSVWWAAAASVAHFFPPADLVAAPSALSVFLSAFSVDRSPPRLAETVLEFPARRKLVAHLSPARFSGRDSIRIRYRLLPTRTSWIETRAFDLDLGSLWWGTHTLEIQSRFYTGEWSPVWRRTLVMLRPWWFTWPALLAFAGIGFGGGAAGIRWHKKRSSRARTALPEIADWRVAVLFPEEEFAGKTLDGRYRLLSLVARGGFATVLEGVDLHTGRSCAIKIFRRDLLDEEWLAHRFQQEVAALEQIRCASVVSIFGQGIAPGGTPYLVMEFIEGDTLRTLLNDGPVAPQRAASLLRQAAAALQQIHARGIYHRDLKPENLMLRRAAPPGEDLVLIDFSIAIVKEPDQTIHGLSRAAGTIYYMAPEQAVGFATPASDIYSLAKIVLEMLTGRRLSALLPDASMDLPDRVRELLRSLLIPLSAESLDLLSGALQFDPSRRPQEVLPFAAPIARDLSAVSSGLSANPGPSPKDASPAAGSAP